MKFENLLLFGAIGLGAYFLFSRPKVAPKPLTAPMVPQYYPGLQMPYQVGAPACPPGYYLEQGMFGTARCVPVPAQVATGGAPVTVKASEDLVYVDGKLVPVSEVFK